MHSPLVPGDHAERIHTSVLVLVPTCVHPPIHPPLDIQHLPLVRLCVRQWTCSVEKGKPQLRRHLDSGRGRHRTSQLHLPISAVAGMRSGLRQRHLTPAFGDVREGFQEEVPALTVKDNWGSARGGSMESVVQLLARKEYFR